MTTEQFTQQFEDFALDGYSAEIADDSIKIWDDDDILIFDRRNISTEKEQRKILNSAIKQLRNYINS